MKELARGNVADRPWGMTLGALGVRGLTGEVELQSQDKRYTIVFDNGAVVGATSPLAADSAARIAVTNHMVTATQVGEMTRWLAAEPDRDEIDVIAEGAKLSIDKADRLRRRVAAQRAARTFTLDDGAFVVRETPPSGARCAIDIRPIIYLGALMNMSDERLTRALAGLGTHFRLKREVLEDLAQYGFTEAERGLMSTLLGGASLAELYTRHRELDERTIMAVVYTLTSGYACMISRRATGPVAVPSAPPPTERLAVGPAAPPTEPVEVTRSKINPNVSFKSRAATPTRGASPPTGAPASIVRQPPAPAPTPPPAVAPSPPKPAVRPPPAPAPPPPVVEERLFAGELDDSELSLSEVPDSALGDSEPVAAESYGSDLAIATEPAGADPYDLDRATEAMMIPPEGSELELLGEPAPADDPSALDGSALRAPGDSLIGEAMAVFSQLELEEPAPPVADTPPPPAAPMAPAKPRPRNRTDQLMSFVAIPRAPAPARPAPADEPAATAAPLFPRRPRETPHGFLMPPRKPSKP